MKTGIATVACGHPAYGRYAAALAITIRASGYTGPLAVLYSVAKVRGMGVVDSLSYMTDAQRALFTDFVLVPESFYTYKKTDTESTFAFHLPKMYLDVLSPYENTLFIDSDTVIVHDLNSHVNDLRASGHDFLTQVNSMTRLAMDGTIKLYDTKPYYTYWSGDGDGKAPVSVIRQLQKTGLIGLNSWLPQSQSTYLWFTPGGHNIFTTARKILQAKAIEPFGWSGSVPDEAYFNAAYAVTGRPKPQTYRPIFSPVVGLPAHYRSGHTKWSRELLIDILHHDGCIGYTPAMEGANVPHAIPALYNEIVTDACKKLHMPATGLAWKQKSTFNPLRRTG
jgi:hypothetical protein